MRRIIPLVLICGFIFPLPANAWETYIGKNMTVRVQSVTPGNVLAVRDSGEKEMLIRLYGIGIPTSLQPLGHEAHNLLVRLLPKNTRVTITTVNQAEDGVISALVQLQDRSINNRLVSEGLAWVDRATCKAFFCRRWHIEEHTAIKERRGLWALNMSTPPWQWGEVEHSAN